ncbi:MAG: S24/S26 family peptidase [Clostridia bacterium]|nr:S24/S26 family peptidase [Clostridia bacterium]
MPLIQEAFAAGQGIRIYPRGVSMRPLIREGQDSVTLSAPTGKLGRYEIALFTYHGRYLLHRVVGRDRDGGYVFCGDNCYTYEHGVQESDIIAVVTDVWHGDTVLQKSPAEEYRYLRFVSLRRKLRRFAARVRRFIWRK